MKKYITVKMEINFTNAMGAITLIAGILLRYPEVILAGVGLMLGRVAGKFANRIEND